MFKRYRFVLWLSVCLSLAAFSSRLQAQSSSTASREGATGLIRGTVVDQTGRVVQGAAIAVHDAMPDRHATVTNGEGQFAISGLAPGAYSVQVSAAGFATLERNDIMVTAGNTAEISLSLKL